MNNVTILLVTLLCVSGCSSISDISTDPRFSEVLGRDIPLKEQAVVCSGKPLKTGLWSFVDYELIYDEDQKGSCTFGETVGVLKIGSPIDIYEVKVHKTFGVKTASDLYFIARSSSLGTSKQSFYISMGSLASLIHL
ncbi:hypothetical protein ACFSJ3_17085 [Corallincola platygyrae]|uniref:Lipoprotein n=1 Tax=Corallincola platygyrae TaxID=1193278 RepID=A0ABW4XQV2_9GAMM